MSRKNAHVIMTVVCFVNILVGPSRFLQGRFLPLGEYGANAIGYPVLLAGGALFFASLLNLRRAFLRDVEPVTHLVESGIYRFVRHPVYLSFLIILIGFGILTRSLPSLLFTVLLSVPSIIHRARCEGEALRERFLDRWDAYARRMGFLLPRV